MLWWSSVCSCLPGIEQLSQRRETSLGSFTNWPGPKLPLKRLLATFCKSKFKRVCEGGDMNIAKRFAGANPLLRLMTDLKSSMVVGLIVPWIFLTKDIMLWVYVISSRQFVSCSLQTDRSAWKVRLPIQLPELQILLIWCVTWDISWNRVRTLWVY